MELKHSILASMLLTLAALPGIASTLAVDGSATPDGGLYDYSYQFSVSGAGSSVDNIYLGSDDLSPLNVVLEVNGTPTADWSWLGNDTPQNYLQFFDTAGTSLGNGDVLDVTFSSAFAPRATEFAVGLDSSGGATNTVNGIIGPVATPEPGSLPLLLSGMGLFAVAGRRYARWIRSAA